MDYGLCLPNFPAGASPEGIEAGADVADRLGWSTVWTTDHVWSHRRRRRVRTHLRRDPDPRLGRRAPPGDCALARSVIVVPQRNAVVLAKELASLDSLSDGRRGRRCRRRLERDEFANLGVADRFGVRGAYLDETIRLWRHLWSGLDRAVPRPVPLVRRLHLQPAPGRRAPACRSSSVAGRSPPSGGPATLGDGYHSTATSPSRVRPAVWRSCAPRRKPPAGRCPRSPPGSASHSTARRRATRCAARPRQIAAEVRAFADAGVSHLALTFGTTDPGQLVANGPSASPARSGRWWPRPDRRGRPCPVARRGRVRQMTLPPISEAQTASASGSTNWLL